MSTIERDRATELAKTNPAEALAIARGIVDPWFRAQALAWIGRYFPGSRFEAVLAEAQASGAGSDDAYVAVAVSAWGVRALLERDARAKAAGAVETALARSRGIRHPVRRLDALFLLFHAVFDDHALRTGVLEALMAACVAAKSWKAGDRMREAALMLATAQHPLEVVRVLASMPEGKHRRTAMERIRAGEQRTPRKFFW